MRTTKTIKIIIESVKRGYKVTEDGRVFGLTKELIVKTRGNQRYPTISVSTELTASKVFGIPLHQLAAYCFYGVKTFSNGIVVRHLNGNVLDVSKQNIVLGTYSENNLDKLETIRINAAQSARASQGYLPINSKLPKSTREEIRLLYQEGYSLRTLANEYSVSKSTIYNLISGKTYDETRANW